MYFSKQMIQLGSPQTCKLRPSDTNAQNKIGNVKERSREFWANVVFNVEQNLVSTLKGGREFSPLAVRRGNCPITSKHPEPVRFNKAFRRPVESTGHVGSARSTLLWLSAPYPNSLCAVFDIFTYPHVSGKHLGLIRNQVIVPQW